MEIEILTRQIEKKSPLLTIISNVPGVQATGDAIQIPDLILHISHNYLLLKTRSPGWADRIVPLLFTVVPINASGQFYEPVTDVKILVTAKCHAPAKFIQHMHEISHLDLEKNELLGIRLYEWKSRDVAVVAHAELAVQGCILTARVKFSTHFRDSRYNCQACVDQISLLDLFKSISPEFITPPPELKVTGPVISASQKVSEEGWVDFINSRPAPVKYIGKTDEFYIDFGNAGRISFKMEQNQKLVLCNITINNPEALQQGVLNKIRDKLIIDKFIVFHEAKNILIPPDILIKQFSFSKTPNRFHEFSLSLNGFTAIYNVKELKLSLTSAMDAAHRDCINRLIKVFKGMIEFMDIMVEHANTVA